MTDLVALEAVAIRRSRVRSPSTLGRAAIAILGAGLVGFAVWDLRIGRQALINGRGFNELGRFFAAAVHPRIDRAMAHLVGSATVTTLSYAVLGTVLSATVGFVVGAFVTPARFDRQTAGRVARTVSAITIPVRGVHEVLWALILLNLLGINPLVAVLAIAIPFSAVSAKVFSELFAAQPRAPFDALRALGAGRNSAFFYAVIPNAARDCISYAFYRFECAIRSAAVLGVVGAGGLGYELLLSFQSANYHEMWTCIWALVAMSAVVDSTSTRVRSRRTSTDGRTRRRAPSHTTLVAGFLLFGVLAAVALKIDVSSLWSSRTRREFSLLIDTWLPPDFSTSHVRTLVTLARETVAISVGSLVVSVAIAAAGSLGSARLDGQGRARRTGGWVVRSLLLLARSIPAAVWAYLAVIAFFSGPFPAAVALGIYNGGVLGRMLGEVIENLDRRPRAALLAGGASSFTASIYGSLPLAAPSYLTYSLYRWEVAMRETVVVGIAASGGLGYAMKQQLASFAWPKFVSTILAMILLTLAVDLISARLRRGLAR